MSSSHFTDKSRGAKLKRPSQISSSAAEQDSNQSLLAELSSVLSEQESIVPKLDDKEHLQASGENALDAVVSDEKGTKYLASQVSEHSAKRHQGYSALDDTNSDEAPKHKDTLLQGEHAHDASAEREDAFAHTEVADSIVLDESDVAMAVDMGSELQEHGEGGTPSAVFNALSNSGIGMSKAVLQGTRLQAVRQKSGEEHSVGERSVKNQYLNADPQSVLIDKITHISGKTLDLSALLHDLKELSPDLIKAANQESLGGFAAAANDLLLYRKIEELGGEQYRHISIGQLRALIKRSIPSLTDNLVLECYRCFKSCIKNEGLEHRIEHLAKKYNLELPKQRVEAFLFTDESDFEGNEGLLSIRRLVIETYCNYEDELTKMINQFDIKNSDFSKAYDEVTFYYYLIAHKSGKERDFRVYEAMVKLKNHIELFILMRGAFIRNSEFAIFSDSELGSEVYDDRNFFDQHSYHSAKELAQLEPCGMHFCYLESVLNLVISIKSSRNLLFTFIEKFGQLYISKACGKFFNPTMDFEFNFMPSLLCYVYGIYISQVGSEAFYKASSAVADPEAVAMFVYDMFCGNKVAGASHEYELMMHKFKGEIMQNIQQQKFSDELKEWVIHVYHQEVILATLQELIVPIVTCGHPISKDENFLNNQVIFELLAFYSKYLINIERKHLYAQMNDPEQVDKAPEDAGARETSSQEATLDSTVGAKPGAASRSRDYDFSFGSYQNGGAGFWTGIDNSEDYGADAVSGDLWLLGENGYVPLIPGTPALSAFLMGRAFTYGELIEEQNNSWGFCSLTYADICGNYLATTYLAHYYQALFDNKLNAQGQLFFLYHMRAILAFHLGMTSIDLPWSSLKLYHNYDYHVLHNDIEIYFKALKAQDESWARLFKNNPTLEQGSRFEGRQPLLSTVFGTIVGNSLIYLCDAIEQDPKLGDFYHNSLILLINLLERCLKAEYSAVCCFAVYRLLTANLSGNIYGVAERSFSKYFPHSTASTLLFNQLFPKTVKGTICDDLISEDFSAEDIANMFLQVGMLSPAHREQGYNLLNHHLSSYKGNFAPLTEPYLDELYRTSAALGNGNSLSYLSESAHALGHETQSELYALMGARLQTGHLYKKLSHYFIKNDMPTERRRLAQHMFFMHRPYGFYDSYLVLKDQKERINEAHTFLFYAAYMSVPEAIAELEALEKAHLFNPLPFVVYLKYLEELAYTKVEALLTLRLLSQSGGILPVNSFYFMKYLERNHEFFSNSMLKKALLESGQINLNLGAELYSMQSSSCSELFKSEQDYLRLNSYDIEGNFATYHQLLERNFNVEHFNAHNSGDTVVQETVTKLFDSLVAGKTQLERAIFLNWRMADSFPSYLQAKADAMSIEIESEFDFATIDSVMSSYRGALDTYPLSISLCLGMDKRGAHILDNNRSLERIFHSLIKSELIPNSLEAMYVCALQSLRGRGRPHPQYFLNFCRYLANSGDSQAICYSHMSVDHLNMVPYGDAFNETMVSDYEKEVSQWSKYFASRYFDGDLFERLIESLRARQERDFILTSLDKDKVKELGSTFEDSELIDDIPNGYGNNLNSVLYSDRVGELSSMYGQRTLEGYQQIISVFKKQENLINALIYKENQDLADEFVDGYIDRLQKLSDARLSLPEGEIHDALRLNDHSKDDETLDSEHYLLEVFGPLSTAILKAQHFDATKLFKDIEPWLKPGQKISIVPEHKSKLYIKSFIDFAFFMKCRGWNIAQSLVCSRNGWQLGLKEHSAKRSYASLLAKDMLTGAPGGRERFLYYVQSHGFKYHLNDTYFKEDESKQTARNFVNNVLQIDIKSSAFESFAKSMEHEDFAVFNSLLLDENNGCIAGRPRLCMDGLEYDVESGYLSDPEAMVCLSTKEAIKARDELKTMASTLNKLMDKEQELKVNYFTCSDRLMDSSYGDNSKLMRAQLERILGVENIERLLQSSSQWLSYSFYDSPEISFDNMLSMLGISCAILPYRLLKGVDSLSARKILQNSQSLVPTTKIHSTGHKELSRALAEDLNDLSLYGVNYDERAHCWHLSKEQLRSYANQYKQEPSAEPKTSVAGSKSQESLRSSYNYALYQENQLCVHLAKLYLKEQQDKKDLKFKRTSGANAISAALGPNLSKAPVPSVNSCALSSQGSTLFKGSDALGLERKERATIALESVDNEHVEAVDRSASGHLSMEERELLGCMLAHHEYHGSLLKRRYKSEADKVCTPDPKIEPALSLSKAEVGGHYELNSPERLDSKEQKRYQEFSQAFLSTNGQGTDEISTERSAEESLLFGRLNSFLGSKFNFLNTSETSSTSDSSDISSMGGMNALIDSMSPSESVSSGGMLQEYLSDPNSLLGMIYSKVWDFDESKEEQFTRPHLFHEDENPLHVYIHTLLSLRTTHEGYQDRLKQEELFLDALYSQGYFFGCSDLVDSAFKNTLNEAYRYRFDRHAVAAEVSNSISNLAGSILQRLLSPEDVNIFYQSALDESNEQVKRVAQSFNLPVDTPKRYVLTALINYSDDQVTRHSRYYKALISATQAQLQPHNYEVLLDDSLPHQAFYDLFNCRSMIARAPNVMHWLYLHNFKGMDIGRIEPSRDRWDMRKLYTQTLAKSIQGDSLVHTHDEQFKVASSLLVDSPELGYQNVKLAKFHALLSKDEDCRRLSYIEQLYGAGTLYDDLDGAQCNSLDAMTLKFIKMQDVLHEAGSKPNGLLSPFVCEYIFSGLALGNHEFWSAQLEEQGCEFARRIASDYGYSPILSSALGAYRNSVVFDEEDRAKYELYFDEHPLALRFTDKDWVDRLVFCGRHKEALAIHNALLDQLENALQEESLSAERDERLACYEYAQSMGMRYFVYDEDNFSDVLTNIIIAHVCSRKEDDECLLDSNCLRLSTSAGLYVPVDSELQEDDDEHNPGKLVIAPGSENLLSEHELIASDLAYALGLDQHDSKVDEHSFLEPQEAASTTGAMELDRADGEISEGLLDESQMLSNHDVSALSVPQDQHLSVENNNLLTESAGSVCHEISEYDKLKHKEQGLLDDNLYYSGYDEYDYSGYDNYGDCYSDACAFEKKTLDPSKSKAKKASAKKKNSGGLEPYEHMSLTELLDGPEEYPPLEADEPDDEEPMIMSYDQMEAFSQFLAQHNINPMDIDSIADALVKNHFEILDQKGLSPDDIARTMRENGFEFDEQAALNEIDQLNAQNQTSSRARQAPEASLETKSSKVSKAKQGLSPATGKDLVKMRKVVSAQILEDELDLPSPSSGACSTCSSDGSKATKSTKGTKSKAKGSP